VGRTVSAADIESSPEVIHVADGRQRNAMASSSTGDEQTPEVYAALLSEIEALLGDARKKVNAALLASIKDSARLRELTRLDGLLVDPARLSQDLLRHKSE
jgi:hypothetical protein